MGHIYTATSPDSGKTKLANAAVSLITGGDPHALDIDHSERRFLVVDFGADPAWADHLAVAGRAMASFGEAIQKTGVPIELLQELPNSPWWDLVVDIHFGLFFSAPTRLLGHDPQLKPSVSYDPVLAALIRRLDAAMVRQKASGAPNDCRRVAGLTAAIHLWGKLHY